MNLDPAILIGAGGVLLAAISIAYARSQALDQRRQVEEMQRQTEELRRAQHFETSHALMKDAISARQEWVKRFRPEWIPPLFSEKARQLRGGGRWRLGNAFQRQDVRRAAPRNVFCTQSRYGCRRPLDRDASPDAWIFCAGDRSNSV